MEGINLYYSKFVILEFQLVAHVDAEGQQGDGDFGDNAGVVVLDEGIVAADVDDSAEHKSLLSAKTAPVSGGGRYLDRMIEVLRD